MIHKYKEEANTHLKVSMFGTKIICCELVFVGLILKSID